MWMSCVPAGCDRARLFQRERCREFSPCGHVEPCSVRGTNAHVCRRCAPRVMYVVCPGCTDEKIAVVCADLDHRSRRGLIHISLNMGETGGTMNAVLPEQFGKYSLIGHLATGGMAE